MSYTCRNCNRDIRKDDDWFHQNGMYRCDGKAYAQDDSWLTHWAVPDGVYGYWPSVVPGPFGKVTSNPTHSSYTHPAVTKPVSPQRQLLLDAADTVDGERQDQYGNAEDSFAVIADLWQTYINRHAKDVDDWISVDAKDVALMMVLFKVAREGNSPKRDNILDGAGYFGLAQRIEEKS